MFNSRKKAAFEEELARIGCEAMRKVIEVADKYGEDRKKVAYNYVISELGAVSMTDFNRCTFGGDEK